MNRFKLLVGLALVCVAVGGANASARAATSEVCFPVGLRGGVTQVCADVHENANASELGTTIFAVHGLSETAAAWGPLVDSLFADPDLGVLVRRVIAIDLPGHGDSPFPLGLPGGLFGELVIEDNVSVILQSLSILAAQGLESRVVMGHSMGGLAIQAAQEALLSEGTNFAALGVQQALLLAPVPAGGQQWTQPPPSDITPFLVTDPTLGTFFALSPFGFQLGGSFRTTTGALIPNLPSVAQLTPFVGAEPIATLLQLVGQLALPRPSARKGAFHPRNGTRLTLLSFSEDILVPAGDLDDLYTHLLGLPAHPRKSYRAIVAADAVHGMFISNPQGILDQLKQHRPAPF